MSVWDESPLPPPAAGTAAAPPPSGPPPGPPSAPGGSQNDAFEPRRVLGLPIWLAVVLGSVICVAIAAGLLFSIGSDDDTTMPGTPNGPAVTGAGPSTPVTTVLPPTVPPTTPPVATASPTTTAPTTTTTSTTTSTTTTSTATTTPTTSTPTTATPTTSPVTTTPATTPATVSTEPATQVGPEGQRLTVTPRRGPCGSAPDCLVVSFTIEGFASPPETFVCEFASGRRFEFRFSGDGVDRACATNDVPDSIVVEVGGLRSDPVTNSG